MSCLPLRCALILAPMLLLPAASRGQAPAPPAAPGPIPTASSMGRDVLDALAFGAKADGVTDATAAVQKALDAAGKTGGIVRLPAGRYLVAGSLRIPVGVALVGVQQAPVAIEPLIGTVVLATGGRDREDAPALFEMGSSSVVQGLTVFYPEQKIQDIHPYAWTFHLQGFDNTVENVTLINSYNGIRIGPEPNVRHRIRSVVGCVLRRGLELDNCTDIGRIENVQWHNHWWSATSVGGDWKVPFDYMAKHCEGFIFGRSDWEYVTNTFIFPTQIGYHFIATPNGSMNGQLCGIGADAANRCVVVDAIQPMGLLITNGQFVAFTGENPIEVVIAATAKGSVRLQNCDFWGPAAQNVVTHGPGFTSLSNCYFSSDHPVPPGKALVEADDGKLQVQGCSFGSDLPAILLGKGLKHAIVTGNNGVKGVAIINQIGDRAILTANEAAEIPVPTKKP
ncbi:glycosyl hydrolase family 28-related protein [Aquisphaera insulae]|uniref:glycosyl hydrolase family 28-related protein n=1 Tax=Aquisphaera insulae TaxID=2712864 RepID=UPI0013EAA932|nr:glycosyl hydrolase family 28-related protein [Aquisphaera insulae]